MKFYYPVGGQISPFLGPLAGMPQFDNPNNPWRIWQDFGSQFSDNPFITNMINTSQGGMNQWGQALPDRPEAPKKPGFLKSKSKYKVKKAQYDKDLKEWEAQQSQYQQFAPLMGLFGTLFQMQQTPFKAPDDLTQTSGFHGYKSGGEVVTDYDADWDYRYEGGEYYTRKKGKENWIKTKGDVRTSIKENVFKRSDKVFTPAGPISAQQSISGNIIQAPVNQQSQMGPELPAEHDEYVKLSQPVMGPEQVYRETKEIIPLERDNIYKGVMDTLSIGESKVPEKHQNKEYIKSEYDVPFAYGEYAQPDKPISQMTIKEVQDFQKKQISATKGKIKGQSRGTGAVGRYQVTQTTLKEAIKALDIPEDAIFTPELQEEVAKYLLDKRGLEKYLNNPTEKNYKKFRKGISQEWASVPLLEDIMVGDTLRKKGDSYWSGQPSVSLDEFEKQLQDSLVQKIQEDSISLQPMGPEEAPEGRAYRRRGFQVSPSIPGLDIPLFKYGGAVSEDNRRNTFNFLPTEMIPIQTEKGEYMASPEGDIVPVGAKKKHSQMKDDEITDYTKQGNYVFSNAKEMSFSTKDPLFNTAIGIDPVYYTEGQLTSKPKEYTLKDFAPKGKFTPAKFMKHVANKFPITDRKFDAFANRAQDENKESRKSFINAMRVLNDAKRPGAPQFKYGGNIPKYEGFNPLAIVGDVIDLGLGIADRISNKKRYKQTLRDIESFKNDSLKEEGNIRNTRMMGSMMNYMTQDPSYTYLNLDQQLANTRSTFDKVRNRTLADRQSAMSMAAAPTTSFMRNAGALGLNPTQAASYAGLMNAQGLNAANQVGLRYNQMMSQNDINQLQMTNPYLDRLSMDRQLGANLVRDRRNALNAGLIGNMSNAQSDFYRGRQLTNQTALAARMGARNQQANFNVNSGLRIGDAAQNLMTNLGQMNFRPYTGEAVPTSNLMLNGPNIGLSSMNSPGLTTADPNGLWNWNRDPQGLYNWPNWPNG